MGVLYHITSLKPFRPGNSPDPWEHSALQEFERGARDGGAWSTSVRRNISAT